MTAQECNWAGNVVFGAPRVHRPASIAALQELVRDSRKVKVVGARHSFTNIADCAETLISLEALDLPVEIDRAAGRATVPAGITYGALAPQLHAAGLALHNMASLPHITVAGAISTATHGSGDKLGNLATAVVALEVVTADGDVVEFSRERDATAFEGAVVGLGGVGALVRVTLAVEPAYTVQQEVYLDVPLAEVTANFDAVMSGAYSVSLFPTWQSDCVNQLWRKHRVAAGTTRPVAPTYLGGQAATIQLRPSGGASDLCTPQLGQPGPWHERIPHFRADAHLPGDDELQTEYFVPRAYAADAMRAVAALGPKLAGVIKVSEIRSMAADRLWMSMAYGEDTVGIHFSWHGKREAVAQLLPLIEASLLPYRPRPHWGKLFALSPATVRSYYPRLGDFRELLQSYDPAGKFRNAFLDAIVFG